MCRCGSKFGQHNLRVVIEPKDECFTCQDPIDSRLYRNRGNFCAYCTRVAELNARHRIKDSGPKTYKDYLKLAGIKFHGGE